MIISWNTTNQCNMFCDHCYRESGEAQKGELNTLEGKKLLEELCDPGRTPRVPSLIRDRARAALRHFPQDYEIDNLADKCPELFDKVSFNDKLYTNGLHK